MPYIQKFKKDILSRKIKNLMKDHMDTPGEVTFAIYKIILEYSKKNPCYSTFAICTGILDCTKLEFYRKIVAPYEEKKIKENGDVT